MTADQICESLPPVEAEACRVLWSIGLSPEHHPGVISAARGAARIVQILRDQIQHPTADMLASAKQAHMAHDVQTQLTAQLDAFTRHILNEYLGRTDWTMDELKGRGQWIVADHINPGRQSFFFDGVELFSVNRYPYYRHAGTHLQFDLGFLRIWNPKS